MSMASSTQLFNPVTRAWSERLLEGLKLPAEILPDVVAAGTKLGPLRPEIAQATGLEDTKVVAGCSHQVACALAGLPIGHAETWAFLQSGPTATLGTELLAPIINDVTREWEFSNELGFGGSVRLSKRVPGLWILDECRRAWSEKDRSVDGDLLMHLATSSEPFESLLDLSDPRFHAPGDMPLKIQAYCRETNQAVPRKPGPTARCVLESLALLYRRTLHELECVSGREFNHVYVLGNVRDNLLHHFTANALQIPVTIVPQNIGAIGNVIVQALALGHLQSLPEARQLVRDSFRTETLIPHAAAWDAAYNRLSELTPADAPAS
jgi:rhamnulokinase